MHVCKQGGQSRTIPVPANTVQDVPFGQKTLQLPFDFVLLTSSHTLNELFDT